MHRRLTELARRVRHFFRSMLHQIRNIPATIRRWLAEWLDGLVLPFRFLLRPRALGSEVVRTGREALSLSEGAARGTFATIVGFCWFIICSPLLIARYLLYDLPYRVRSFTHWNAPKRALILVLIPIGAFAGLGTWGYQAMSERRATFQRDVYWRMFFYYVEHAEIDKVEKALVELQRLVPDNGTISERLNMVRTREAPLSDPLMVRLIMRTYYREQRFDLAAKEAAKLVVDAPNDWEALCFLTNDALIKGDMEAVRRHIADMPRARDVPEQVYLWTIPYALNLYKKLGETTRYEETIDYTVLNFLPRLLSKDLDNEHPFIKILLLECYDHAISQIDKRPQLTRYWDALQRASRSILHADGVTANDLARLGVSVEQQLIYLQKFVYLKYIKPDDGKAMAAEVESRLTEIWNGVLRVDPKNPKGYVGLAHQHYRAGNAIAAVELADRGIAACGTSPLLVACRAKYLCAADPQAGRAYLEWAISGSNGIELSAELCKIWCEVERVAAHRDKALEACRKALELEPGLYWAHVEMGKIYLELEEWTKAAAALEPIRGQLVQDPIGCRIYVWALSECGAAGLVDQMLQDMHAEQRSVEVLAEVAKGFQHARRYEDAIRWARRALDREEYHSSAMNTLGECYAKLADKGESGWDRENALEAIRYFRRVQRQQPKLLFLANNIAWLELKALGNADDAYQSAAPLRASESMDKFPAGFFETLGLIEVMREHPNYEEGRKLLERAIAGGEQASFYYHLALAYHGLDEKDKAEEALWHAGRLPKSPREQAEYLDIAKTIRKGR